jgi:hypothetical protein
MAIRTIFSMAEECAAGERTGWSDFVRDYGPVSRTLLTHYFPPLVPEMDTHVAGPFTRAYANDGEWFRELKFQNEREFAMAFRELVFTYGRAAARLPKPEISLDQFREIVKDLPVVERQLLWLCVKGYSAAQISPMMMNAEATSNAVKEIADKRLAEVLPEATSAAFTVSARALMEAAEQTKTDQCLSLRTYNNLVNGQITWRERELAEQHMCDCFYCLDQFTAYQEMIRINKDRKPLGDAEVERVLATIGVKAAAKKKGFLSKLIG